MFAPSFLSLAEVMAESAYTEEQIFDLGISGNVVFLVVVPEVGACRVPNVALSHFMAGADEYTADKMPEHWSGALSGPWTIKRDRLRILPKGWQEWTDEVQEMNRLDRLAKVAESERAKQAASITYHLPLHSRLEPRTAWRGGLLADTDLVTLEEAARLASKHAGAEVTPADLLRAAAHGRIQLLAVIHHGAKSRARRAGDPLINGTGDLPKGGIPTLPLEACQHLANIGHASWRTIDGFEARPEFAGELCRFAKWELEDDEPSFETSPSDCRVKGAAVHALADAFASQDTEQPDAESLAAPAGIDPLTSAYAAQKAHRLAANCYEIFEAAEAIARQQGLSKYDEEKLRDDMAQAAFDDKLTVRSPRGHDQYAPTSPPDTTYSYYYLTTPDDVNRWAKSRGFGW
jgi:hypothetical protein